MPASPALRRNLPSLLLAVVLAAFGARLIGTGFAPDPKGAGPIDVEITALGKRNPAALGSEVWLQPIGWPISAAEAVTHSDPPSGFKESGAALFASSDQPVSLRLRLQAAAAVEFVRHPWSGMVRISVDGVSRDLDLYADPALEPLRIDLASVAAPGEATQVSPWRRGWSMLIGAAGVLVLALGIRRLLALAGISGLVAVSGVTLCALFPLLVAARSPIFVTGDGMGYLAGAVAIDRGDWDLAFTPLKAPLLYAVSAVVLWFGRGLRAIAWLHAGGLLLASALTWLVLKPFLGRSAALVVAALFLVHPVAATYQSYLLRESLSVLSIACLAWLVLRIDDDPRPPWAGAFVGVCVGLGALLRENFVALVGLVPLVLCGTAAVAAGSKRTGRLRAAAAALAVSLCLTVPYMAYNKLRIGNFGMTVPKTQFNALINAWEAGLVSDAEDPQNAGGSYFFVARLLEKGGVISADDLARRPGPAVVEAVLTRSAEVEELARARLSTAFAERGWDATMARVATFFVQAGLWSTPASRANDYYARPQRGYDLANSNYQLDLDASLSASYLQPVRPELEEIVTGSAVRAEDFRFAVPTWAFEGLYRLYRGADWVLSAAFFVGLWLLARRRHALIFGMGLIAVVNWLGAAWLISQVDRFAVPFLPLKWIIGSIGIAALGGWLRGAWVERARRTRRPASDGEPGLGDLF